MEHSIQEVAGLTVLVLSGELDMVHSVQMSKLIQSHLDAGQDLAVDLSAVSYIDSSGVASLVEGYQKAREGQLKFGLVEISDAVLRVLELARLDKVFSIYASAELMAG